MRSFPAGQSRRGVQSCGCGGDRRVDHRAKPPLGFGNCTSVLREQSAGTAPRRRSGPRTPAHTSRPTPTRTRRPGRRTGFSSTRMCSTGASLARRRASGKVAVTLTRSPTFARRSVREPHAPNRDLTSGTPASGWIRRQRRSRRSRQSNFTASSRSSRSMRVTTSPLRTGSTRR